MASSAVIQRDVAGHGPSSARRQPASITSCRSAMRLACADRALPRGRRVRPALSRGDQGFDGGDRRRIESRGRLIEQQHLRPHEQRANQRQPQPLAGRQSSLSARSSVSSGETELRQSGGGPAHVRKCSPTVSAHQPGSAGTYPTRRRHSGPGIVGAIAARQGHDALIGIEIRNGAEQQGFARAGRAPDGDTLALRQAKDAGLRIAVRRSCTSKHRRGCEDPASSGSVCPSSVFKCPSRACVAQCRPIRIDPFRSGLDMVLRIIRLTPAARQISAPHVAS